MEVESTSYQYRVAGVIALIGLGWNVYKILVRSDAEWVPVKGKLVEYKTEDDPGHPDDFGEWSGKVKLLHFGYYEFEDHKGEKRIHSSENGYRKKYPALGSTKIFYYEKERPGLTSDSFDGGVGMNYYGIVFFGIILVGATYFYASIEN